VTTLARVAGKQLPEFFFQARFRFLEPRTMYSTERPFPGWRNKARYSLSSPLPRVLWLPHVTSSTPSSHSFLRKLDGRPLLQDKLPATYES
jgi:hypothetical protein